MTETNAVISCKISMIFIMPVAEVHLVWMRPFLLLSLQDIDSSYCSRHRKGCISMFLCRSATELRQFSAQCRKEGKSIGLVPTMGALHEGHASLIKASHEENDVTIVSVFVNPTQFGPAEDYDAYPRTLEKDCRLAESFGADVVFAPTPKEMYPHEEMTWVEVTGEVTKVLCGRSRPIHFRGVTTVVSKLFHLSKADRAYFGLKDAQQTEVLRRMVEDLFFDVELRIMPIIREPDGLAKSSRNTYLSEAERKSALILSRTLEEAKRKFDGGEKRADELIRFTRTQIEAEPMSEIDYVEMHGLPGLTPVCGTVTGKTLLAVAVKFGKTRLIDNIILEDT